MFINREGERVPEVNFKIRKDGKFIEVSTEQIFKGKTVVLFSLPGAFIDLFIAHLLAIMIFIPYFKKMESTGRVSFS